MDGWRGGGVEGGFEWVLDLDLVLSFGRDVRVKVRTQGWVPPSAGKQIRYVYEFVFSRLSFLAKTI